MATAPRAPQPAATGHPQQGVVLCNTPVVTAVQPNGAAVTSFCAQSQYHEGPHGTSQGLPIGWPKSIYNNK